MKNLALILLITLTSFASNKNKTNSLSDVQYKKQDSITFLQFKKYAEKNELHKKSIAEITTSTAKYFLKTPYVFQTLRSDKPEHLMIDLHEFNCVTYLENVVALNLIIQQNKLTFQNFCQTLTKIRYRDGKIDKYPSRLHYFSDWIWDNQKRNIVKNITAETGGVEYNKKISFMSDNSQKYHKLANNPEFIKSIQKTENEINKRKLFFLPKNKIEDNKHKINSGDLIAITTTIEGLDCVHVGFALKKEKQLYFIHASMAKKEVTISSELLSVYLKNKTKHSGIIIARINKVLKVN